MSDLIPLVKPISEKDSWSRTLPGMSNGDPSWIVAVLEDLSAFAEQCCSCDVQNELNTTALKVRRLISMENTSI
jgi:hypothetical protein